VTEAVYEAGYGSSSRVYERADTRLGMTPNRYRQGGLNVTIRYATIETPLGLINDRRNRQRREGRRARLRREQGGARDSLP
jgi:AraC-like DNA-binding protein